MCTCRTKRWLRARLVGFACVVLAGTGVAGCGKKWAHFNYETPTFHTKLRAANFEYVRFGVVGQASIPVSLDKMIATNEIGLVNEALRGIYADLPQGEPLALVNIVMDVSRKLTTESGLITGHSSVADDVLVIRADVVRFTGPVDSASTAPRAVASLGRLREIDARRAAGLISDADYRVALDALVPAVLEG